MPDDVSCAFHPGKRAVEVCDGTGSYICALCAVPVGDKTYSADFLNNDGLKKAGMADAFSRNLPRPDVAAWLCVFLPVLFWWTLVGGPILLIISLVYYFKHLGLMRKNSLYAKVSSDLTTYLLPVLIGLCFVGMAFIAVAVFFA
ncbi:MAG: hypothetical protein AAF333_00770 [Planctomycetota bacterium]